MVEPNKENNELVIYSHETDVKPVNILFDGETMWLTVTQIAAIFNTGVENVRLHIKKIYAEGELDSESTSKDSLEVVEKRPNYRITTYNLDVVISVGYRVSSKVATKFRTWATKVIRERISGNEKGLTYDEQRLMISDRVAVENNELMISASEMGVTQYAAFFNAGYQGMYVMKMDELKKIKGISNDRLLDRAGITELAANEFRITQANAKLRELIKEDRLVSQGAALATHFTVAREVRDAIKRIGGTLPEELPVDKDNIHAVRKRITSNQRKLIK